MRALLLATVLSLLLAGCADDAGSAPTPTAGGADNGPAPIIVEDFRTFTLGPEQDIEWKYRLDEGAQMDYTWSASRPVRFDFHGDRDDGTEAFTSHKKDTLASDSGTFTAPFTGRHGWYFRNGNAQTVTLQLEVTGDLEVVGRTGGNAP